MLLVFYMYQYKFIPASLIIIKKKAHGNSKYLQLTPKYGIAVSKPTALDFIYGYGITDNIILSS